VNFLKKLFVRRPEDLLEKGEKLLSSGSVYESRLAFEEGLQLCTDKPEQSQLAAQLTVRISEANNGLATLNIEEAEHAINRSDLDKAAEHLELALSLTSDPALRKRAESLLSGLTEDVVQAPIEALPVSSSCSSCSQASPSEMTVPDGADSNLSSEEYYELLILQLPGQLHERYAALGEDFADMYISASHDNHLEALDKLEKWFDGSHHDIYSYEKGKILHQLGKIAESEACMRAAIRENDANPLPHLGLALLLIEEGRLGDAEEQLDSMIERDIFTGQALMMRGEVFQISGRSDAAIEQFAALLETPLGHAAADRLYGLLLDCGRQTDADHIFKKYLSSKCKH
jgi:predicted negative regulator of RcsB-dependent stress response